MTIEVGRIPTGTAVEGTVTIPGQVYDWGKSKKVLATLVADVPAPSGLVAPDDGLSCFAPAPIKGREPMTGPSSTQLTLLVLYSPQLEACHRFYSGLGLTFTAEQHGKGPEHYAAILADGTVFELYPARPGRQTDILRLGLGIDGSAATPPLAPGHHTLTDPDGRTVEIHAS